MSDTVNKRMMSLPINKYELTNLTKDIAGVRIYVCHTKANPNGSYFEQESLELSKESFKNKPIVGSYVKDDEDEIEDFGGHDLDEAPVGVIPETNNYTIETLEEQDWAVVDGLIFKEYCPIAYDLIKSNDDSKKISMEIEVIQGEMNNEDGLYHIKQFNLLAVTILGDRVSPAMGNNATITLFSKVDSDKFALKFSEIINKAKNYLEGGDKMDREQIIAKFSSLIKDEKYTSIVENAELSVEDLEKELFSLSMNQIYSFIGEEISKITYNRQSSWDGSIRECTKYWVEDVAMETSIAILCDREDNYNYVGVPFSFAGDQVTLDYAKCKRYVRGEWREFNGESDTEPKNPVIDFEKEVKADVEAFSIVDTKEYKAIASELTTLKASYTTLESENKELNEYKLNKETDLKEAEYDAKIKEFSALEGIEDYIKIVENKFDFSLEQLEEKLIVIAYKNNIQKGNKEDFSIEGKPKAVPIDPVVTKTPEMAYAESRYGAEIVKRYSILK